MEYLHWKEEKIEDESGESISRMYDNGFVFTRIGKGIMHQTRSVRVNLNKFELSSENRRILRKGENITLENHTIPFLNYSWEIGKIAKDFYDKKAGGAFSVNKIKEIITTSHNFNTLFSFNNLGYAICYINHQILHYCYPFYDLEKSEKDMGLIMMTKAISEAKTLVLKYVYLGSLQRSTDIYKLQFSGIEWFDGKVWKDNIEEAKELLKKSEGLSNTEIPALPHKPKISQNRKHLHIIGICGVATSAIAIAFSKKGWLVTGSDKGFFPPVSTELEKNRISFYAGWHPEKIGTPDMIMTGGSGTSPNNPEVLYAKENNIPVYDYPVILQKYFIKNNSIVTAGTWGKTTTSSLLSFILIKANKNPSYFTGGLSLSHDTGAITDTDWSVVEGDEYQVSISDKRPKFVYYQPSHLLLTSVSWDHADLYPTEKEYFKVFEDLIEKPKIIVACKDDIGVKKILKDGNNKRVITYGKTSDADYHYHSIKHTENGLNFYINDFVISSPMLGKFNAENITGCFAMAMEIGIEAKVIIQSIKDFGGIKRRFEKRFVGNVTVLDCHAPTPEKAQSVLESIKEVYNKNIFAVYEPNIGGRQRESISKYNNAFKDAYTVIVPRLSSLKTSQNIPMEGEELTAVISKTHKNTIYIEDDNQLVKSLVKDSKKGDVIVFLGSHGFRGMIEEIITSLRQQSQ